MSNVTVVDMKNQWVSVTLSKSLCIKLVKNIYNIDFVHKTRKGKVCALRCMCMVYLSSSTYSALH